MLNLKDYISKYGSRIKDIEIELHDYKFYHRPNDPSNPDQRFIGRQKEVDKLKTILTNSEVKSGTYLLTGFRGMGKTSIVNKILQELESEKNTHPITFRYLRILIAVWFFSLFDIVHFLKFSWTIGWGLLFLLPLVILGVAIYTFGVQNSRGVKINSNKRNWIYGALSIFYFSRSSRSTSSIYSNLCQDYFVASLIHLGSAYFLYQKIML